MHLTTPNQAWILRKGSAELFVCRGHSQRPLGLVHAPGWLPGPGKAIVEIVAKLSDDAEIEAVTFETLRRDPAALQDYFHGTQALLDGFDLSKENSPTLATTVEIEAWQENFLQALDHLFSELDQEELKRQEARARQDESARQRASRVLTGVLLPSGASTSSRGDLLLSAMKVVGWASGIEVSAHPEADSFPSLRLRIQATARASHCRLREVALTGDWWKQENGPILAFAKGSLSPVALLPSGGGYRIDDPSGELSGAAGREAAPRLETMAFSFYRGFPELALSGRKLAAFVLRGNWRDAFLIVIMAGVVGLLGLAVPYTTSLVFDYVIPGGLHDQLWPLGAGLAAVALGAAAFSLSQGFLLLRIETRADRDVQSAVIDRLLRLPAPFFRRYSVGDLANRSMGVDTIRQILSRFGVTTLLGAISSLGNFFILFHYGWTLSVLALGLGLAALATTLSIGLWSLRPAREVENLEGAISGVVNQFIVGVAKLRVTGAVAAAFEVWAEKFAAKSQAHLRMRRIQNVLTVFNVAFPSISTLLIFAFAYPLLTNGEGGFTTGGFLAYSVAFGSFLAAIIAFSTATIQAIAILPLAERAAPILETLPESASVHAWPGELTGEIDIRHVSFRYAPDTPLVVEDISFTVRPGEFVAVVGPSGSGKSTLLRLLLGFEEPGSGAIYYNGHALGTLDRTEVRRQIGVVLQSSRPLAGDILGNIAGTVNATFEQAWAAAEIAGLADDIRAMPMGMHTLVSEDGGGISGGQRQRLMIARAVAGDPRILFFDEATSALDNETQAHVAAGLRELRATRVVIAHRLSTIVEADRIVVFRDGRIVETGDFASLMERRGFFHELASRQLA